MIPSHIQLPGVAEDTQMKWSILINRTSKTNAHGKPQLIPFLIVKCLL